MKYVAFLRGIMPQMIKEHRAENLKTIFKDLGFLGVKTFLASGNVIFESSEKDKVKLESKIEKAMKEKTGRDTTAIVRSQEELAKLIKANPFKSVVESAKEKPNVTFFKNAPDRSKLPKAGRGFIGYGFESGTFCYTVDMVSVKTPEAMMTLEKEFGKEITTRTWNTVLRVYKLLNES